ncbi:transposase [Nocardia albiluteola]|uniref:transposase n=1 Tax=Nocardia albiluteola TaxID=2842303 RepID=UPI0027DFF088|nr:transposase [Nocardia albiluteola]
MAPLPPISLFGEKCWLRWHIGEVSGRWFSDRAKPEYLPETSLTSEAVAGRVDLTDAQWARLKLLLPCGKKAGRPPKWTKRQLIDGIRWRCRVGSPWRDVPAEYGSRQAAYGLFRRWQPEPPLDQQSRRSGASIY